MINSIVARSCTHVDQSLFSPEVSPGASSLITPFSKRHCVNFISTNDGRASTLNNHTIHTLDIVYPGRISGFHIPDVIDSKNKRRSCKLCYSLTKKKRKTWSYCKSCMSFLCHGGGGRDSIYISVIHDLRKVLVICISSTLLIKQLN